MNQILINTLPPKQYDQFQLNLKLAKMYDNTQQKPQIMRLKYRQQQEHKIASALPIQSDLISVAKQLYKTYSYLMMNAGNPNVHQLSDNNFYLKIISAICNKEITVAANIITLLNSKQTYGAFSLWRNLYEMDVVFWALFSPAISSHDWLKTNSLLERYYDYTAIESAAVNGIALHISKSQYIYLDSNQKKIYDEEQRIYQKYNSDDYDQQQKNPDKLVKSYDWANPIFSIKELETMLPPMTPNLYLLVEKSKKNTEFFNRKYTDYVRASGYIHSSYLSTKYSSGQQTIDYIANVTKEVVTDFIIRLNDLPYAISRSLIKGNIITSSSDLKKAMFMWNEYSRICRLWFKQS